MGTSFQSELRRGRPPESVEAEGIVLRSLSKHTMLGDGTPLHVLAELDIMLERNKVSVLIGPSGCGKSTLIRIIAGLEAPTSGEVLFRGIPGKRIGIVFQDFTQALMPWRTVLGNVEVALEIAGEDPRSRRQEAERLIEMVGLDKFKHAFPRELSGGMRQRVQIARVLSYDPDVLLL